MFEDTILWKFIDEEASKKVQKNIDILGEKIEEFENIDSKITEEIINISSEMAPELVRCLRTNILKILKKKQDETKAFEEKLNELWKDPLDLLELFLSISFEIGSTFNEEMRPSAVKENDYVFDALTRLHARACLIGNEIINLLYGGFASGAHARWRSLHETTVIAFFIKKFGDGVAEKYLLHDGIESYKAMLEYQKYSNKLGYPPISIDEIQKGKESQNYLVEKFGKNFKYKYGWASEILNNNRPNFFDLEKEVNLDHFRPFYRMASHAVHAGPKGINFNLGFINENENILLTGPSIGGLTDPGHSTAISLAQINTALINSKPSFEGFIILQVMSQLVNEIGNAFLEIHNKLEITKRNP